MRYLAIWVTMTDEQIYMVDSHKNDRTIYMTRVC